MKEIGLAAATCVRFANMEKEKFSKKFFLRPAAAATAAARILFKAQ